MSNVTRKGFPVIGAMFLALAVWEFLQGDNWVVWVIIAFLFGGFGIFSARTASSGDGPKTTGESE